MASTDGTRRAQREAARAERRERERAEAARAGRRRRLFQLGGAVALAAAVIATIAIASGSGDDRPRKRAGESVAGAQDTARLLRGIPQSGAVLGDPKAPVTLVEFADLQCPWCKAASEGVLPTIIEQYVRDGRVKLVFRDVAMLGDDSVRAAQMAGAAGLQGKLWDYVHLFYVNQGQEGTGYVTDDFLREVGGGVHGLDVDRSMDDRGLPAVQRAIADAKAQWSGYGLDTTPSFVAGRTGAAMEPVDDVTVEALQSHLDRLLAAQG